jgi:heme/copper-type cytochrome/quinol oxidase subunit 2
MATIVALAFATVTRFTVTRSGTALFAIMATITMATTVALAFATVAVFAATAAFIMFITATFIMFSILGVWNYRQRQGTHRRRHARHRRRRERLLPLCPAVSLCSTAFLCSAATPAAFLASTTFIDFCPRR